MLGMVMMSISSEMQRGFLVIPLLLSHAPRLLGLAVWPRGLRLQVSKSLGQASKTIGKARKFLGLAARHPGGQFSLLLAYKPRSKVSPAEAPRFFVAD